MYGDYMIDKVISYCLSYNGITKGKKKQFLDYTTDNNMIK